MTSVVLEHNQTPDVPSVHDGIWKQTWILPVAFALLVMELLAVGILIWSKVTYRVTHPGMEQTLSNTARLTWSLTPLALLALGLPCAMLVSRSARRGKNNGVMLFSGLLAMLGMILVGGKIIEWEKFREPRLIVIPASLTQSADTGKPAVEAPDASKAKKPFGASCAACHGPTGDGVPDAAPSLRASEFVAKISLEDLRAFIAKGRPVSDPANRTGKPMPAKGGNLFLSENDIGHIAAWLKANVQAPAANGSKAAPASAPAKPVAVDPATLIPKWVVPPPPVPDQAVVTDVKHLPATAKQILAEAKSSIVLRDPSQQDYALLFTLITGIHGMHLLITTAIALALLWYSYAGKISDHVAKLARVTKAFWIIATVAWMVLVPILYVL